MSKRLREGTNEQESAQLVRRYQRDHEVEALDALFRRYWPRVHRIVSIRTGGPLSRTCDIEDLVQETFLAALEAFDRFDPGEDCRLIQWLARIAERKRIDLFKYEHRPKRDRAREVSRERLAEWTSGLTSGAWEPAADATAVPERAARDELSEILDDCIAELPERQREMILLRDYVRGSWRFVAEELGCVSEEAARKQYARARVALLTRLNGRI